MKHKSLPAVLLAVLLCICTLCVPVYAASATEGGLTVTLTADKTSYRQDEPIAVTLTVTNNNDAAITGVALEHVLPAGFKLAEEAVALGRSKWDDRDVQHGNLFAAVAAYRDAIGYLETVNPKPPCMEAARKGLEETSAELEKRYRDQRFLADQALNRAQWDVAQRELLTLMEMIPDRHDERNREASAKLMDVEKRMKGGK